MCLIKKVYIFLVCVIFMAKGEGNDIDKSLAFGSQTWNVADGYTKIKILKHLVQLDHYENIALFGTDDMDEFPYDESDISRRREEALRRVITTLKQLLGNVKFALNSKESKELNEYYSQILFVEDLLGGISRVEQNLITNEVVLKINEPHFSKCIRSLQRIKDEVNIPINRAGLIFRNSDEIDLDKITNEIIEGG